MTRKQARELAFKLLYEMEIQHETPQNILDIYYMQYKLDDKSKQYVENILYGVYEKASDIDKKIAGLSKDWNVSRLSKVITSCLRIAIFEIENCDDIPNSVAVNEAVGLVKIYDSEESARFVNGILASILKSLEE